MRRKLVIYNQTNKRKPLIKNNSLVTNLSKLYSEHLKDESIIVMLDDNNYDDHHHRKSTTTSFMSKKKKKIKRDPMSASNIHVYTCQLYMSMNTWSV